MAETSPQDHYAGAARRHHDDAVYLHDDGRLPNADHHYGFAVECALKSLLLRYLGATLQPKTPGGKPQVKPWVPGSNGKPQFFEHLPHVWSDVAMLLHGRSGSALGSLLQSSQPFASWDVGERYLDGEAVDAAEVTARRAAAHKILLLHQQALTAGVLS
ncbi:MAG: hypothetical protein ACRDOV_04370 [Streptomyces sp.]